MGYSGLVLSDYTAAHVADLQNGLDQEFATDLFNATWLDSVKNDAAVLAAMDSAVARNLYQLERFGYLNCASADPTAVVPTCVPGPARPHMDTLVADHQLKVQQLAEKSAVLLKNVGGVLPLQAADLARGIVVVGPAAQYPLVGPGGERTKGFSSRNRKGLAVTLKELAASANITYIPTIDWVGEFPPNGALTSPDGTQSCLVRDDFDGVTTTPAVSCDATIDYSTNAKPIAMGHRYTWTGKLVAPSTGTYFLWVRLAGALPMFGSAATLTVDGALQALTPVPANANEFEDGLLSNGLALSLAAGTHDIVLAVANTGMPGPPVTPIAIPPMGPIYAQFRWAPYDASLRAALDAAKNASAVIVVANDATGNSTGMAATSSTILAPLDAKQDELISAIASVNAKTIVVLQNGQPVAMPWASSVPAILETWYPGQEGGYATANLLLGNVNPGGHLPVTFPARAEDTPFAGKFEECVLGVPDAAVCGAVADCGRVTWSEGLLMGYRWYDQSGTAPLFAFGEGLSYTTFAYSALSATATDAGIDVSFTVKNTGTRIGDAIPQVYLDSRRDVPTGVQVAKKSLVGFERVPLKPEETKSVHIHISERQLSYWMSGTQSWVPMKGKRTVHLSTSSRPSDIVDSADVIVP
ncbi:MAG: glycoside hydrolase family 3 C-terminal domain-containing protein [Myxococcales bacterium]